MKLCTVDGCDARVMAKGWCSGHYQRFRIHGDPLRGGPLRVSDKRRSADHLGQCVADDCEREVAVSERSLCTMHYQRWRKHGDANVQPKRSPGRWISSHGYVLLPTGSSRMVMEHRVIMEQMIGRPLLPSENVHHMNGVRDDNRPENLELWVKRQPPGQRVTDRIADALALLNQYAPELLRSDADERRAA